MQLRTATKIVGVFLSATLIGCASTKPSTSTATAYEQRVAQFADHKEDLLAQYDMSNLRVNRADLFSPGVGKDGINAIWNPNRIAVADVTFPSDGARVAVVQYDGEAVAYPLAILAEHEVANDTVGGEPIAVVYCPLCDSVTVVSRRLPNGQVSEFGVSGMLYESNVVIYDRATNSLWSQVGMEAISGPFAGDRLKHLPIRMTKLGAFRSENPNGLVLGPSDELEEYTEDFFFDYFSSHGLYMPVDYDESMPANTLGIGVAVGSQYAAFITEERLKQEQTTVKTPAGPVTVAADETGMRVVEGPPEAASMQTFWFAWSATHPQTQVFAN